MIHPRPLCSLGLSFPHLFNEMLSNAHLDSSSHHSSTSLLTRSFPEAALCCPPTLCSSVPINPSDLGFADKDHLWALPRLMSQALVWRLALLRSPRECRFWGLLFPVTVLCPGGDQGPTALGPQGTQVAGETEDPGTSGRAGPRKDGIHRRSLSIPVLQLNLEGWKGQIETKFLCTRKR